MFRIKRKRYLSLQNKKHSIPLSIVGDGAIVSRVFNSGKMCPLVIVDTKNRPDVERLIKVHEQIDEGDVTLQWLQISDRNKYFTLHIQVHNPIECDILIDFEIYKHAILVEAALLSKAVFIQAGKEGDRPMTTSSAPKIYINMSETNTLEIWRPLLLKTVIKHFRRGGLERSDAEKKAEAYVSYMRSIVELRFPAGKKGA